MVPFSQLQDYQRKTLWAIRHLFLLAVRTVRKNMSQLSTLEARTNGASGLLASYLIVPLARATEASGTEAVVIVPVDGDGDTIVDWAAVVDALAAGILEMAAANVRGRTHS